MFGPESRVGYMDALGLRASGMRSKVELPFAGRGGGKRDLGGTIRNEGICYLL